MLRFPILVLFVLGFYALGFAQLTVDGSITNERGEELPGANILVQGAPFGTTSDEDGTYQLLIPDPGPETVIEVRFLGYKTQTRRISRQSGVATANFQLREDVLNLDQVVVTGNSVSAEKSTLGNTIATVNANEFESSGAIQIDAALSGKVAGAQINQMSGTPGGGTSVRIRGSSTISRSAEPLYIVDGVIISNSSIELVDLGGYATNRVADLDPNDIERIEIVKGAAAAALYGSRANDGVVQIFTRRGQPGKLKISFKSTFSIDNVENRLEVNQFPTNAAGEPVTRFDYQDNIFQTGHLSNTSLSLSGGDARTRFYLSGSFQNQSGVMKATDYEKGNVRLNLDRTVFNWLDVSTNLNYIRSRADLLPNAGLTTLFGVITNFLFTRNDYSLFPDPVTGEFPVGFLFSNPLESIENWKAPQEIERFVGGINFTATPFRNFFFQYRFGIDNFTQNARQFVPRNSSAPALSDGLAVSSTLRAKLLNSDIDANYAFDLSPTIRSTTAAGINYQEQDADVVEARAEDIALLSTVVQGSRQFSSQQLNERRTFGFYLQQTFALNNSLFVTGSIRSDASSVFGKDERQQWFPKASASWELSNYNFWRNTFGSAINRFRFRGAYGFSGGQPAESFLRFSTYIFEPNSGRSGLVNDQFLGNEQLKPERMQELEIGGDLELLNGRIGLEATYYNQKTKDLILPRVITPSTGFTQQLSNVGELTNKGLEFLVRGLIFNKAAFSWTSTFSVSTFNPEIKKLSNTGAFFIPESFGIIRVAEEQPPGHFWGTTYVRDADGNILDGNGDPIEQNGRIVGIPAIGERAIIGDPNPEYIWSFINDFTVGSDLSLRLQFDAMMGHDLFNFDRRLLETPAFGVGKEYERELSGEVPTGFFQARRSIFEEYIEKGDWMKLRELSVRYTLRASKYSFVRNLQLNNIQLSVTGRNLFTVTDFTGWDPETNAGAQRTLVRGFSFATIPIPRSIMFGIALNY